MGELKLGEPGLLSPRVSTSVSQLRRLAGASWVSRLGAEMGISQLLVDVMPLPFVHLYSRPRTHRKPAAPDRLLHTAQFGQPGHAGLRYSLRTCDSVDNIGVAGSLGRDTRPIQAGRMRPALDIRFHGQGL